MARPSILGIRTGDFEGYQRLVIQATEPLQYRRFGLERPNRLVVDFPSVNWKPAMRDLPDFSRHPGIADIRFGQFREDASRMVLDLKTPLTVAREFIIPPSDGYRYRIVLDLQPAVRVDTLVQAVTPSVGILHEPPSYPTPVAKPAITPLAPPQPVSVKPPARVEPPLIIIDAGHGGVDPGAPGVSGTREKDLTLRYAKTLADVLKSSGRYRVHLTRSDDRFLKLRQRIRIAQQKGGDLFISLHADSAGDSKARGLSIYTVSEKASDAEAAKLAARENKVDILGGMDLSHESEEVAGILIDLARRDTKNKSVEFAGIVVDTLSRHIRLLRNSHRFAGFAVLKAPDIPSVLIELGFLSSRKDEALLNSSEYRARVTKGILQAIDEFFARHPKT